MSEKTGTPEEPTAHTSHTEHNNEPVPNPWDDVMRDFKSLGESIAKAVQDALKDERHKESLNEMRAGVEDVADKFSKSMDETRGEVKTEVKKAVGEVKEIGSKVYKDSKPIIVSALETLNDGLQNIIEHLKEENVVVETTPQGAESTTTTAEDTPEAPKEA